MDTVIKYLALIIFYVVSGTDSTVRASTCPTLQHNVNISGKDTLEIAFDRYYPVAKGKMIKHLRLSRKFNNLALAMLPLTVYTVGLSYLAGLAFAVFAVISTAKVRNLQNDFPELEEDPEIASKIRNCYIRTSIMTLTMVGLPAMIIVLISSFLIFGASLPVLVFFTALLALALFILMDWLIFHTGKNLF